MLPQDPNLDFLDSGAVRVHGTRVGLEHVLLEYLRGAKQEDLPTIFPTVNAEQAAGVISYYHANQAAVERYLAAWHKRADELEQSLRSRPPTAVELRLRQIAADRARQ